MNRRDTMAEAVLSTKTLLARYLVGFDDTNLTRMGPYLPNHVAWTLGHLALTMYRVATMIDGKMPPQGDFIQVPAPAAAERVSPHSVVPLEAFHPDAVAFGSKPVDDPRLYPSFTRCGQIYNGACDRLAAAVRGVEDAELDRMVRWGGGEVPLWSLVMRMVFHNGTHTGQIVDLRRSLGFKSVFA